MPRKERFDGARPRSISEGMSVSVGEVLEVVFEIGRAILEIVDFSRSPRRS